MDYHEIFETVAPCGLNCRKCLFYRDGEIKATSAHLREQLGEFDEYAERFAASKPVFHNYPQFKELLAFFSGVECAGCRKGECVHPDCGVQKCFRDKEVDFCYQCGEFPCDHTHFNPDLEKLWIKRNQRMRAIGVEDFYKEVRDAPRYRRVKK